MGLPLLVLGGFYIRTKNFEGKEKLDKVVDDFNPAEDGEAGEEPHGSANEAELATDCHLPISLNLVKGSSVKEDLNELHLSTRVVGN